MEDKEVFQNIDYLNKVKPTPRPDRINDIDTKDNFYDNIISAADNKTLDINSINAFTNVSRSRDEVYNLLDLMGEDPIISSALDIYAADACEPNDKGQIVWAESDDENVLGMVTHLLDSLNVDKNTYGWVYSLIKYGDLYLRLYRNKEYNKDTLTKAQKDELLNKIHQATPGPINEDVILNAFSKNDHYAEYMEAIRNPAEVFNLTKLGKSYGYLRTHITNLRNNPDDLQARYNNADNYMNFHFNRDDVDVYAATEFVHACLDDNSSRTSEEVNISTKQTEDGKEETLSYSVKRGQSILYNSFKIWRELKLLENSVLLNRITKSSIVRTISVEVGDMEKNDVRNLLQRVKQMVEQKSALNVGNSMQEYTNPGPIENCIYIPTHDGKGAITPAQIGGDVSVGDLTDLDYWKNKLYGSLGIPKQFLGDTEDSAGFNGGSSLSLISSRYAKSVKRIQNAYIQAITDAINLMLLDKGLVDYIGKFSIRMQAPTTQEEKDRKDNLSNTVNTIQNIMNLMDGIEDVKTKLVILKSLLSSAITDTTVITAIQDEIDRLEEQGEEIPAEGGEDLGGDFGGLGGGAPADLGGSAPIDLGGEEGGSEELPPEGAEPESSTAIEEPPEENFYSSKGSQQLSENNLPTFEELGVNPFTRY